MSAKETKQEEPEDKDGAAAEGGEGEEKPKSKKKMIIAIVAVILFAGLGVGAYLMGMFGGGGEEKPAGEEQTAEEGGHGEEHAEEKKEEGHGEEAEGGEHGEGGEGHEKAKSGGHGGEAAADSKSPDGAIYHPLPDFLVNLNSPTKRSSFLKVTVTLVVADEKSVETVKGYEPRIIDSFQTYLRELRPEDLKGSGGIFRLREELLLRINKIVQPAKVNDILFKDMIVQ
ncbi:flagellar basal body protein FliL [bacterium]|nr:flagellar basal body protein FliL [bacterium]